MKHSRILRLLTMILALILVLSLAGCGKEDEPIQETTEDPASVIEQSNTTEPVIETQPPTVPATMGTVTAGELNIRKSADGEKTGDTYKKGDRIEILETKIVDGTKWGRTGKGWIGMGYVRMDGTAPEPQEGTEAAAANLVSDGTYGILGYGVVDLAELNVRSGPGTGFDKLDTVTLRTRYAYYQEEDGWVRIENGWVSTEYFYIEGTTADDALNGTILTDNLNIRSGPGTEFSSIGTCSKGDTVKILAQVHLWGYTPQGWISMDHVEPLAPTYTTGTGTITSGLNIRKEPNADSEKVDVYRTGDTVTILEVQGSWGKTDKGWINLMYVQYD